jgi:lipid-A-disaccharide synthase
MRWLQQSKLQGSSTKTYLSAMEQLKNIVIVAGEESGDAHAAELIRQLKEKHPMINFSGVGGVHMQDAGAEIICHLASHGVTGLTEVIKHFKFLYQAFHQTKHHLKKHKPDMLILVDCPGFNLPLAKYAKKKLGLKVLYYISPQIWAWKAGRIHKIRQYVDHMAVIFPFEKEIYQKAAVPVSFVGHPLVKRIDDFLAKQTYQSPLKTLPKDKKIIALLPGSRNHEILRHMPVLNDTAEKLLKKDKALLFLIPKATTVKLEKIKEHISTSMQAHIKIIDEKALDIMAVSDFVIVASGTASLEAALLAKPMCIIYQSAFISYLAAAKLINIQYIGLCNILSNQMLVPELLQYDFTSENLFNEVYALISNPNKLEAMRQRLIEMKNTLSSENADCSLLQLVEKQLQLDNIL